MFAKAPLRKEVVVPLNHLMISTKGDIPVPPPPYELLGLTSTTEWDERLRLVLAHLQRTTWSTWLRIYVLVGVIISSALPWPIIILVQRAIIGSPSSEEIGFNGPIFDQEQEAVFNLDPEYRHRVNNARIAAGGILLGILLLVWVPLLGYLSWQSSRLQILLNSFTSNDSIKGRSQSLIWSISRVTFIRRQADLIIGLPASASGQNSVYHPEAYLPAYVGRSSSDSMQKGGGSEQGSWGRNRPEMRERFDYGRNDGYGAPVPSYQIGGFNRV